MALSKKQLQVIDTLTHRVNLCREFMNDWLLFNQIMSAYTSPGVNKAQLEGQFLKIKSKLAREHKVLKDNLGADYQIDGNTMNIVSGATSLESIYSQSDVSVKKLQNEWHRAFISINETLGSLEDKKLRAEAGEKVFIMQAGGGGDAPDKAGAGSNKSVLIVVVLFLILGAIAAFILINPGGLADAWRAPLGL